MTQADELRDTRDVDPEAPALAVETSAPPDLVLSMPTPPRTQAAPWNNYPQSDHEETPPAYHLPQVS